MTETAKNTATSLQRFSPYAVDGGCDAYGQMEEDDQGDYYNREDCDAALAAAIAREEGLREALSAMRHAVCGDTGFANAVRLDTGKAYDWPALERAEEKANAALEAKP